MTSIVESMDDDIEFAEGLPIDLYTVDTIGGDILEDSAGSPLVTDLDDTDAPAAIVPETISGGDSSLVLLGDWLHQVLG